MLVRCKGFLPQMAALIILKNGGVCSDGSVEKMEFQEETLVV